MKIAFVLGHHEKAQGAVSPYFGMSEWKFYNKVMEHIPDATIFYHDPNINRYTERIKNTAKKLNKLNFDLVIELHFNAAAPEANGCETLYYFNSEKSKKYALIFSEVVNQWTNIKLRNKGLKALVNSKDRGFASVYYPKAPTILIEPFFGSNYSDCRKIKDPYFMACIIKDFVIQIS